MLSSYLIFKGVQSIVTLVEVRFRVGNGDTTTCNQFSDAVKCLSTFTVIDATSTLQLYPLNYVFLQQFPPSLNLTFKIHKIPGRSRNQAPFSENRT